MYVSQRQKYLNKQEEMLDTGYFDVEKVIDMTNPIDAASERLFAHIFGEEAAELINWWLFEKESLTGTPNEMYNEDGTVVPTETIDDLWRIVSEDA